MNIDALIFDFDGVVADTEPTHMAGFQDVLSDLGITITEEQYYAAYVGYDDRDGFTAILRDNGVDFTSDQLQELIAEKTRLIKDRLGHSVREIPGAANIIRAAHQEGLPLAICSGALHDEIVMAATTIGVGDCFPVIVSAEDVARGKPDPEGYYLARRRLAEHFKQPVEPCRCVVCEDTPHGIAAAKDAGMKVCGLTTTHNADDLVGADMVIRTFTDTSLAELVGLV